MIIIVLVVNTIVATIMGKKEDLRAAKRAAKAKRLLAVRQAITVPQVTLNTFGLPANWLLTQLKISSIL